MGTLEPVQHPEGTLIGTPRRSPQRGSAMLVTMIVTSSLIAGAAVLVSMQLASTRASGLVSSGLSATYCAEAGLDAARPVVTANYPSWAGSLLACGAGPYPCAEPSWLSSGIGSHALDGGSGADFAVYLKDNDDEIATPNDPTIDNDRSLFIVSRCLKYSDTVKEVEELVRFTGGGTCYQSQQGGCNGDNNAN